MSSIKYKSILFQTIFLAVTALQLIFIPNIFLKTFGFDATSEFWIKILGVVILALSVLYFGIYKSASKQILIWTIAARSTASIGFLLLVLTQTSPANLIIFLVLDLATALWTYFEIRNKNKY
jgi:hypothetical protein